MPPARRAWFQRGVKIDMRGLPRGNETENDAGPERKKKGKPSTAPSNRIALTAEYSAAPPRQGLRAPLRDEQSEQPTKPARSTLSVSNCRMIRPQLRRAARRAISFRARRAREHEVGDVRVRDGNKQATAPNKT
jgi:hypothetical protein